MLSGKSEMDIVEDVLQEKSYTAVHHPRTAALGPQSRVDHLLDAKGHFASIARGPRATMSDTADPTVRQCEGADKHIIFQAHSGLNHPRPSPPLQ
jgi:hypothetical protein